jgi:hypothetical protein
MVLRSESFEIEGTLPAAEGARERSQLARVDAMWPDEKAVRRLEDLERIARANTQLTENLCRKGHLALAGDLGDHHAERVALLTNFVKQ